jgi:UrcA family protein
MTMLRITRAYRRRYRRLAVCLLAASLGVPVASLAQQAPLIVEKHFDPETSRIVHYGDLNLAEPIAQRTLYHRVEYAVYDLCGINPTGWAGIYPKATRVCSDEAWAIARPQIEGAISEKGLTLNAASEITIALGH